MNVKHIAATLAILGSASFSSGIQNWGGDYDRYLRWKR